MPNWTRRAEKDLAALPARMQAHARAVCATLDANPHAGKKLTGGLAGYRSSRLGRSHRIIYRVDSSGVTIMVIRHRKDAYR